MDEYLSAAGASWDPVPTAGEWIGPLLDEFGPTVGHAIPAGYDAHAVVPIPRGDAVAERQDYPVLKSLIEAVAPSTGEQRVHVALWEGWAWLYGRDEDPRTAPGVGMLVFGSASHAELHRAQEAMARARVARPDAPPLALPHRNYFLWSGPLSSIGALGHNGDIPTMIWPEDRSWFIGAPIYTSEIALGAGQRLVREVMRAPSLRALGARGAQRDEALDGEG